VGRLRKKDAVTVAALIQVLSKFDQGLQVVTIEECWYGDPNPEVITDKISDYEKDTNDETWQAMNRDGKFVLL
jgi:hypothetical protein